MIFSKKHRFLFIKTRKTAGSTLEGVLYPILGKEDICTGSERDGTPALNCPANTNGHQTVNLKSIPSDYLTFSIERNPFDKVVSSYFWHRNIKPHIFGTMDFPEYIEKCSLLPLDWELYQGCDIIFKYEEMSEMYRYLSDYTGEDLALKTANSLNFKSGFRQIGNYRNIHTNETVRRVTQLFAREIDRFGYRY